MTLDEIVRRYVAAVDKDNPIEAAHLFVGGLVYLAAIIREVKADKRDGGEG